MEGGGRRVRVDCRRSCSRACGGWSPEQGRGSGCHRPAADSGRDGGELRLPVRDSCVFLIEHDATPDTSAWREECVVDGFSLDPVRQGISRGLERRGEALVRQDNGTQYGILRVPGCAVDPVAIPEYRLRLASNRPYPMGVWCT